MCGLKWKLGSAGAVATVLPSSPSRDVIFGSYYNQVLLKNEASRSSLVQLCEPRSHLPLPSFRSRFLTSSEPGWEGSRGSARVCARGRREGGGGCAGQRETTSPRALGAAPEAASCCPQSSLHPQTRGAGAAPRDPYAGTLLVGFFPLPLSTEEKTLLLRVAAETPPGSGCLVWLPSFSVPPGLPAGSSRGRPRGAGGEVGSPTAPDLTI